jgi:MoaA/NifB/PqqE/SkfB family radical SAM enzyme
MNPKQALTKGVFCPMPWKGLMYNFDGTVKNCIRSAGTIGDLKEKNIEHILLDEVNQQTQNNMLNDLPGADCYTCYDIENGKQRLDIISDRIFYIRELKDDPYSDYQLGNHDLKAIDVRWTNLCNFACVYCGSTFSSRWAKELGKQHDQPSVEQLEQFKNYIFDHASKLKHVYLAGGEPLLMKHNQELLYLLKQKNPDVNLRINTNLSKTNTKVFDTICEFPNVHWTVSVETMDQEFEYIRYGGKWQDFLDNLNKIKETDHKISFNMLYFLLNYNSLFDTVEYFQDLGFHNNSFIIGALLTPLYLNIRHLPQHVLDSIKSRLEHKIASNPGYLLEDSYKNLLSYINEPFEKNLQDSIQQLRILDQRRGIDSRTVFTDLYNAANYIHQGKQTWQNHLT